MGKRGHTEEEIFRVLREAESGATMLEVCRKHGTFGTPLRDVHLNLHFDVPARASSQRDKPDYHVLRTRPESDLKPSNRHRNFHSLSLRSYTLVSRPSTLGTGEM